MNIYETAKEIDTEINIDNNIIDGNEQETFTLEEYRKLIIDYRNNNKDFILARVSTPDKDDIIHNFYYTASEVNKILFKYESDRKLLHRMKVRNPLNNIFIVGQVLYFRICKEEIDRSLHEYFGIKLVDERELLIRAHNDNINDRDGDNNNDNKSCNKYDTNNNDNRNNDNINNKSYDKYNINNNNKYKSEIFYNALNNPNINNNALINDNKELINDRKYKSEIFNMNNKNKSETINKKLSKIKYNAEYFATDDDFLMNAEVREYFKKNSLENDDDFLFELERTQNDIFALLESGSDSENEDASEWKRILSFHISLLTTLVCIMLLLGANPLIILIAAPIAVLIFLSFLFSLLYITCCRRVSFRSMAVRSIDDEI